MKFGLYQPKALVLTKYRKSRINKLWNSFEEELTSKNVLFVKFPQNISPAKLRERAGAMEMKSSRKGIFVEKEGQRHGHMQYNKEFGEYEIILTGKTKFGKRRGSKIREQIPLAKASAIEKELSKLKMQARSEKLKKGEYYRIKVTAPNSDGFSRMIYKDINEALAYLKLMEKPMASRLAFYRYLSIEKVTEIQHRREYKAKIKVRNTNKKRQVNKTGRNS